MRRLRIGIDATSWSNDRGYGRFSREIVSAMLEVAPEHQFICFADDASAERFTKSPANLTMVRVRLRETVSRAASASGSRSLADMFAMSRAVAAARLDVFYSPSVYTYFPLPPRLRAVVTVHDAIAERFPELTLPSIRARAFWWLKVKVAIAQSRRIVTVSEYAARDVARIHRVPRSLIDVAVEAPARVFAPRERSEIEREARAAGLSASARWFIYVGGFNPHKNVPSIVRAHAAVAKGSTNPPHLLLVGTVDTDVFHGNVEAIRAAILECGTEPLVHWTGFVSDERLSALNSGAIALLLPSSAEGFGLPAVEAAACGTPVIATRESPLPELLEGGGYFIDPHDEQALAEKMRILANDDELRAGMGKQALQRATSLDWHVAARVVMGSLAAAVA